MPIYIYTVKDSTGKSKTDTVQAHNEDSLVDQLQSEGYFVVNVRLAMEKTAVKGEKKKEEDKEEKKEKTVEKTKKATDK